MYNFTKEGTNEYDDYFESTNYIPHINIQRPVHYHFIWDIESKEVIGKVVKSTGKVGPVQHFLPMDNKNNFPYKCFFNEEKREIYSFYRQGEAFTVNPDKPEEYQF